MIVSPFRSSYYNTTPQLGVDYDCSCIASTVKGKSCSCAPDAAAFTRMVQVLILKNSNGPMGAIHATWAAETTEMS